MAENEKLKVVLFNYELIRKELDITFDNEYKLFAFTLSGLSLVLGYIVVNSRYEIFLVIPFITITTSLRWLHEIQTQRILGAYLRNIEENQIPSIIGLTSDLLSYKKYWLGTQTFWDSLFKSKTWFYFAVSLFGLPTLVSFSYCIKYMYDNYEFLAFNKLLNVPTIYYFIVALFTFLGSVFIVIKFNDIRNLNKNLERNN